jgi:hypothetical protein
MRSTSSYIVYLHPDSIKNFKDSDSPESFLLEKGVWIQDRFNWATFFFQPFWFFSQKIWSIGILNFIFFAFLYKSLISHHIPFLIIVPMWLIGALYFAFEASYFKMKYCRNHGFLPQLITRSKTLEEAQSMLLHDIQKDL